MSTTSNFLIDSLEQLSSVLRHKLGSSYDSNTLYLITVQGPTCSGKSTFSKFLVNLLKKFSLLAHLVHLDGFYTFIDNSKINEDDFDFDNPATIDWTAARQVVYDMIDKKDTITKFRRTKEVAKEAFEIKNHHNIGIFEGIYAGNLLGEKMFNTKEFDPTDSYKIIENQFIENPLNEYIKNYIKENNGENVDNGEKVSNGGFETFIGSPHNNKSISLSHNKRWNDIKILNIIFTSCFDRMKEIRTERDQATRNLTVENVHLRFTKFLIPATDNWVLNDFFKFDIGLQHGNFNTTNLKLFLLKLCDFFGGEFENEIFKLKHDFSRVLNQCSGECLKYKNVLCFLGD
ncbi:Uridine kinase [Nosema bombycis CQ1]|uniref:Uridine kinase n=1 Tax=Nosema bombycis (strain CQ1 / CVCC 102059) TaxID=578461 RepID=R0KUB2_NOSB1|nr:Uridine kinase [Nosema bombycis CQ1]|eukprot:EOB14386.1 Uridine kinase [Nosema bombycis CQ1]